MHSEHGAVARKFIKKFKFKPISVEKFDLFIIDHHLADDPGTDAGPLYAAFVQERSSARKRLNTAGAQLPVEEAFSIGINKAGEEYLVRPFAAAEVTDTKKLIQRVRTFSVNKVEKVKFNLRRVNRLRQERPDDTGLEEAAGMLAIMSQQATQLGGEMMASLTRFDTTYEAVEEQVELSVKNALEKQEADDGVKVNSQSG